MFRRSFAMVALFLMLGLPRDSADEPDYRLARFSVDVTPPIGHACMGGGIASVKEIIDPLYVHGFVLLGDTKPIVLAAVDWCEIRNDAYERWRELLAEAAGTDRERVIVSAIHQHDTPIADLEAQRILDAAKAQGSICDLVFHEKTVQRVARAVKASLKDLRNVTHLGIGEAKVEKVASNRRYLDAEGKVRYNRMSRTGDPKIRAADEGTIDPWLKTLSFWDGDEPLLALSAYATHPMSYYGRGGVTADFVGMARKRRQSDLPKTLQVYVSGCSGNITAGKYNTGSTENRPVLADRIYQGMVKAWKNTKKMPIPKLTFRNTKMRLEPRTSAGFSIEELQKDLSAKRPFTQCLAALGLSWRKRVDAGATIDVPCLDWGKAAVVLMPAEAYVEFQLEAQKLRPKDFVLVIGYGECAPGYIPTELQVRERDGNLHDWNWVAPGSDARMIAALKQVLTP